MLKIQLQQGGLCPVRATPFSAGYDLYSPVDAFLVPNSDLLLKLKFSMELPKDHYAQIWPRSGLDSKHRITTGADVIDEDYRGEVGVLLRNLSDQEFTIKSGDRIAQMVIMKY